MVNQKAVITFIFETGKEPKATIFNKYGENDSLKGCGSDGLIKLALDDVISLIKEPLTEERLLPRKKINDNNNN